MKKLLIAILLFSSLAGYSQARVLSGFEPSTGRPGYKYLDTLRNIYVLSPLTQPNDSTIGIDTSRFSFTVAKNATRDSVIFSFFSGVRVAIKDSIGSAGTTSIAIFDTVYSATDKGILYTNSTNHLRQDATYFNYDYTNRRLGIGVASPQYTLDLANNTNGNLFINTRSTGTASNNGYCGLLVGNNANPYSWYVTTAGTNETYFGIGDNFAIFDGVNNAVHTLYKRGGGLIIPKMTKTARNAISGPVQGEMVFVTDNGGYLSWYNSGWFKVNSTAD